MLIRFRCVNGKGTIRTGEATTYKTVFMSVDEPKQPAGGTLIVKHGEEVSFTIGREYLIDITEAPRGQDAPELPPNVPETTAGA